MKVDNNFIIKLDNFEGPLDLLLHLIDNKKISIKNIILSDIIDEYLDIIKEHEEENLKIKIEFLIMATELLEIKTYSILQVDKKNEKEEDLEKRIMEYKIYKELSFKLKEIENQYNIPYRKLGENDINKQDIEYDISELNKNAIQDSLASIINKIYLSNKNNIKIDIANEYSTEDAFNELNELLVDTKKIYFSNLLGNNFSKPRIVSLFLTILDMFKNSQIDIIIEDNDFIILER